MTAETPERCPAGHIKHAASWLPDYRGGWYCLLCRAGDPRAHIYQSQRSRAYDRLLDRERKEGRR